MSDEETISSKLADLLIQAISEKSHYYVANCCREAIDELRIRKEAIADLQQKLSIAIEALEELQLGHEHNESNPDYRLLGDTRGWCSACSEKVALNEDVARDALIKIRGSK